MSVRSKQLALGRLVTANVATTLFTVPADRTAIIKSVWVQNQGASSGTYNLRATNAGTGTVSRFKSAVALAQHADQYLELWAVLEEGDSLDLLFTVTNALNYWVSGALLLGDPA